MCCAVQPKATRAVAKAEIRALTVREYGRLQAVPLSPEEVHALATSPARLSVTATSSPGVFDIEARQVVGTVVCPTLRVIIEPKVPVTNFLFLLGFLGRAPRFTGRLELGRTPDLLSAMQAVYARALDDALRYGLVRGYRDCRDELVVPRGRIDALGLVARRFGVIPPISCDYQEFTADIEVNRRLLAAALALLRMGSTDTATWNRLEGLAGRLEGVTRVNYHPADVGTLPEDRRLERYGAAPVLADAILRHRSIELHHGDLDSAGFLVNMDQVYEAFVAESLRRALGEPPSRWQRQPGGLHLDRERRVKLEPDVLWGSLNRPRLVIDVKYKRITSPPNPDVYQMAAYCSALGLSRGVLVYAEAEPEAIHLPGGVEVQVLSYSPDGAPDELLDRAARLAGQLRRAVVRSGADDVDARV